MSIQKLPLATIRQHKGVSFTGITTVFFCHDGKGSLFLTKRSTMTRDEHGRWDPGGGGLKHGVSLEDNVRRELKEEYGTFPLNIEFLGYRDVFREQNEVPTHWLAMDFAVLVDPSTVRICEPEMVDDHGWFTLDTLPAPLHSQFDTFMQLHGEKLRSIINT